MRPLGVGLVYLTELDPLFREDNPDLSVLELEPETFWEKTYRDEAPGKVVYEPNAEVMERIAALPQRKLVHSVAFPVGGSACHSGDYVTPLADAVGALNAPWVSEHLSFNAISDASVTEQVGFLLPPRQTRVGVDTAVRNIRALASQLPAPFAFETGVNYLQPRAEELPDGAFFAAVAEAADCGIVLDLHNLWANERNGRQPMAEVIDALPLDRVWEVHLAGGMMLNGYYLDSHSGVIPPRLLEIAADVIPRLPSLGAIVFEILPGYLPQLGLGAIREQLSLLGDLWRLRPAQPLGVRRRPTISAESSHGSDAIDDIVAWERNLAALAVGHPEASAYGDNHGLARDGGLEVLRTLIDEARDGRVSRAMRFTVTMLLAHLGAQTVKDLLSGYHANSFPDLFTSGEADRFAVYLRGRLDSLPPMPFLREVLEFEHALIRAALYGTASRIEWDVDPTEIFDALDAGRIPSPTRVGRVAMDVVASR